MNTQIRRNTVKIESFGFKIDQLYLRDIILTNQLFSQLNDEDLTDIIDTRRLIEKPKDTLLFAAGEASQGVYVLIEGVANEQFGTDQGANVNMGATIGINSMVDEDTKYDTTVNCEARCTFIFVPLAQMQKFVNNYSDFESTVYQHYFLHKIRFLAIYPTLVEVSLPAQQHSQPVVRHHRGKTQQGN